MRKCWDEKFEKRPEFSFLVHTMGNMLSDGYKKVSFMFLLSFPWLNNRLQRNSNSDIPNTYVLCHSVVLSKITQRKGTCRETLNMKQNLNIQSNSDA